MASVNVFIDSKARFYPQIRLSKIFQWYKEDFGSDNEEVNNLFSVTLLTKKIRFLLCTPKHFLKLREILKLGDFYTLKLEFIKIPIL